MCSAYLSGGSYAYGGKIIWIIIKGATIFCSSSVATVLSYVAKKSCRVFHTRFTRSHFVTWSKHPKLVGGIPTPLKNDGVKVSWDLMTFPTEWKVRKFHGSKPPIRYKGICVYTSWAGTAGMIWVSTRKLREKSSSESRLEAMHKRAIDQANECDFPMVSSKPLRNVAWIRSDWCRRDAKCDPTIHLIHPFMVWPSIPFGFVWKIIGSCQVLMLNNSMFIHFPTEIVQICYQKWYAHSPVNCINRVRNHYLSLYI